MTVETWRLLIDGVALVALFASMAAGYYAWQANRHQIRADDMDAKVRRAHERMDRVRDGVTELTGRLARTEQQLVDMPTAGAVHELALSITSFGGDLKGLVARLDGMAALVDRQESVTRRLEDYLRELGRAPSHRVEKN